MTLLNIFIQEYRYRLLNLNILLFLYKLCSDFMVYVAEEKYYQKKIIYLFIIVLVSSKYMIVVRLFLQLLIIFIS